MGGGGVQERDKIKAQFSPVDLAQYAIKGERGPLLCAECRSCGPYLYTVCQHVKLVFVATQVVPRHGITLVWTIQQYHYGSVLATVAVLTRGRLRMDASSMLYGCAAAWNHILVLCSPRCRHPKSTPTPKPYLNP
jgi:hypothetical protein